MELYGSHFEYAGVNSRRYGLVIATVDTSRFTSVMGDAETVSIYNRRNHRRYYIEDDLSDSAVSFDTEITSDRPLTLQEQREVEKWLFLRKGYFPLFFDVKDDCQGTTYDLVYGEPLRYYLNCRFLEPKKMEYNGGIVGYEVTLECDSPVAWQEPKTRRFSLSSTSTDIQLEIDTDMDEYVYPKVSMQLGSSGGDISIVNLSDDPNRATSFEGLDGSMTLKMDGNTNYISDTESYKKFKEKHFIRLRDGLNRIRVTGDVTSIEFEWQNRRYI